MQITENMLVGDIAASFPSSVAVFQRNGIDFCCGGKKPLGVACEEQGTSVAGLIADIEASLAAPVSESRDWTGEPLAAVIDHITSAYHAPLRELLPRLETMASRVFQVHGSHASHLSRVETIVSELSRDLLAHMEREEHALFPAIRSADNGLASQPSPVSTAIVEMNHDHDEVAAQLVELNRLTQGYEPPDWACQTFRALYRGLEELETSMHLHVHLENNVLFPRALKRFEQN